MDINKWKSCAVDIESYCIIRAMGKNGFRRPGSMIAKLVDDEIRKIAKKEGKSYDSMKQNLLSEGKKLLNGKQIQVGWLTFKPNDLKGSVWETNAALFLWLQ